MVIRLKGVRVLNGAGAWCVCVAMARGVLIVTTVLVFRVLVLGEADECGIKVRCYLG